MDAVTLRIATADDLPLLQSVLSSAVNWDPKRQPLTIPEILARPELAHYLVGWPRTTDVGVVAELHGEPVGAAWIRFFDPKDPGYGFLAADVPELTLGVLPSCRGRGIGGQLLRGILAEARQRGIRRVSLSVEPGNFASRLYRQIGFREVGLGRGAITMAVDLA